MKQKEYNLPVFIIYILIVAWSLFSLLSWKSIINNDDDDVYMISSFLLRLLIEALSIYFLLKFYKIPKSNLFYLILYFLLYSAFVNLFHSQNLIRETSEIIWWGSLFFLFYFISYFDNEEKGYINILIKYFLPFFIFVFLLFLLIVSVQQAFLDVGFTGNYNVSSNQVFFVCLLLPFTALLKNKWIKYSLLLLGLYAAVFSSKRSAMVFTPLIVIISIYYDYLSNKKNKFFGVIVTSLILFLGYTVFDSLNKRYDSFFISRFENALEDKGSGRLDIIDVVFNEYSFKSVNGLLFGSGFNSVVKDNLYKEDNISLSAHNDFIEILYDYGIIGFIIYFIFVIFLLRRIFYLKRINKELFIANYMAFIIFVVMSLVSHLVLYPSYFAYLSILWGITEGFLIKLSPNKKKRNVILNKWHMKAAYKSKKSWVDYK